VPHQILVRISSKYLSAFAAVFDAAFPLKSCRAMTAHLPPDFVHLLIHHNHTSTATKAANAPTASTAKSKIKL